MQRGIASPIDSFGERGYLLLSKPLAIQSFLVNYLIGDEAAFLSKYSLSDVGRIGENIQTNGCRAG